MFQLYDHDEDMFTSEQLFLRQILSEYVFVIERGKIKHILCSQNDNMYIIGKLYMCLEN